VLNKEICIKCRNKYFWKWAYDIDEQRWSNRGYLYCGEIIKKVSVNGNAPKWCKFKLEHVLKNSE
jgi:hypothetical protein